MIKRTNKITALLVAATSMMSLVPAMAADTTKLEAKDGTIENAVAYSDGKYVYQGYMSDDDDAGIYYNDGKEDKELDDLEDADLNTTYQDKYAFANDGDDQYLVDLSSGDVADDESPEDSADNAATKLKTKLKKTDRYGSDIKLDESNLGYDSSVDNSTAVLPGTKFGDSWYAYKAELGTDGDSANNEVTEGSTKYLYGFTDNAGKYIDASNIANIYAYSTAKGKMVKIEEFSNDVDDADDDTGLIATLVKQPVVLTQDKDYIYTLTTVAITDTEADAKVTGGSTTTSSAVIAKDADDVTTVRTYIQKISKEQGDQKDDAYLPKSVTSYEIGNKDGKEFDCDDAKDAYEAFTDVLGDDLTAVDQENVSITSDGKVKPLFTVIDGKLAIIDISDKTIKVTTMNLKKDKVEFETQPTNFDEGKKIDVYFAEKDDDDDQDLDLDSSNDADLVNAYDIDVDGNIWTIDEGKIYKFENNEFTKVYSTDSSLDQISVYDKDNLITWEADGDIFSTVGGKSEKEEDKNKTEEKTTDAAVTPAKTGWDQLADGSWNFYDTTGTKVVSNWVNVGGVWYYLKADGVMATGWLNDRGTWYYLNASGAMQTGWINDNGTWYYCNASGAMLASTTVDGYVLGANGAWIR